MDDILPKDDLELPIEWQAPEYKHKPKSNEWFWLVASGALILIIIAIVTHNFLLGIFAVIAAFTVALYGAREPKKIDFSVELKGIRIGEKLYPYDNLKSFWINYNPPRKKELIIESKRMLMAHITIPLEEIDPNLIRNVLAKFLREEKKEESLIEVIADWLGF